MTMHWLSFLAGALVVLVLVGGFILLLGQSAHATWPEESWKR